jgi:hypothetical protein
LAALVRAGCRVVGQRWTAIRERDGQLEMLHLPGMVERPASPRMRLTGSVDANATWTDLADEHYGCEVERHACEGVFVIQRGRRPSAHLRQLGDDAVSAIRAAWPIQELHPLRRHGQLPAKLAAKCAAYEVALSRDPQDLLGLMTTLPQRGMGIHFGPTVKKLAAVGQRRALAV